MKKTIGILAHVDAGKTTFSEHILYHTNSIRKCGRVDHKDTFLDNHDIERERGITIFSEQGVFEFNNSTYYIVDTPGHVDFSTEMERSIMIMDYAVILVSAAEGVQGHTKTVWNLLRKYNIPTFFFINKLDRVGADKKRVIGEMKKELAENIFEIDVIMSDSKGHVNFNDELIEFITEQDDELLEQYFDGNYCEEIWKRKFKTLIKECKVFPCFGGCALQDEGIVEFLFGFDELTYTTYDCVENENFIGKVFKVRHDDNGTRITFLKCIKGSLNVRDEVTYGKNEEEATTQKISSIRIYNGSKFRTCDKVTSGDIFGVLGLSKASAFDTIGEIREKDTCEMVPTLMSKVIFDKSYNVKDVLGYFKILESEDPSLNVIWNESLKELHVHIMGKIQLEILKEIVSERFNINVEFGPCEILYKETIKKENKGIMEFYTVAPGVSISFNHIFSSTWSKGDDTFFSKQMLILNFCKKGRCDATLDNGQYAIVSEGDVCLSTVLPVNDFYYPGRTYEGDRTGISQEKIKQTVSLCQSDENIIKVFTGQ